MIKKLRIKFIAASMLSLFAVLFIIMGIIGALNYRKIVEDSDSILTVLKENDGHFPENREEFGGEAPKSEKEPHGEEPQNSLFSPELPYESRYFWVELDKEGETLSANIGKIAAVDSAEAEDYAKRVEQKGKAQGFISTYRYLAYTTDRGTTVMFLDCRRSLDTFRTFVFTALGVSTAGLLAVFLLILFLSGRIVKPFSRNYEEQKRFITDAGHELKTPLTIIDADAEILEMDIGENEWLSDIKNQTKRLADLTNSLVTLSRMEEERAQYQMIDFPLSDMAEETVEAFSALAKTQSKTLRCDIAPMLSVHGDEKALRQLMTILLDNAVKYAVTESEISLTLKKQKKQIYLTVFNRAESISREQLSHLFSRFYRTDQSRNSQTGGYGLGLSIAEGIVKAHKGKITASTEDEKSLKITVTLPSV